MQKDYAYLKEQLHIYLHCSFPEDEIDEDNMDKISEESVVNLDLIN